MTKNQKIGIGAGIIIVILLIVVFVAYQNKQTQQMINDLTNQLIKSSQNKPTTAPQPSESAQVTVIPENIAKDPQNATYTIEGVQVTLVDGKSADGNTTMFDTPTVGDLNGDGANDAGVILVVTGGSGTFYYAAAAINNTTDFVYEGTNSIFLGDRIAPQTKNIQNEIYTVNYAERAEGEPMTAQPSIAVTKNFTVSGITLSETSQ
jgi:hypothetical protein